MSRGKIKGRGEIFIKNGADLVKINKKAQILRIKKKKFRIFRRLIKKNLPAYLSKQWFLNKNF